MIEKKVRDWVERHALLPDGARVVAACSGGPDSLALVDLLVPLCEFRKCRLFVAHVDHCMRGAAAEADAAFVEAFCAERGLPFFGGKIDVPAQQSASGGSLESVARDCRYRFLRQVARKVGGAVVATGHHKDDQAETLLLHLLRGSGSQGLGGIRPRQGDLIRPLLCLTRQEIEDYCKDKVLNPCVDETNSVLDFRRNRLRHETMPRLRDDFNPSLTETLCRTAEILSAESDFLDQQASEVWEALVQKETQGFSLKTDSWRQVHAALQRRLLLSLLYQLKGEKKGFSFHHIDIINEFLLSAGPGKRLDMPDHIIVEMGYGASGFRIAGNHLPASAAPQPLQLNFPGETAAGDWGLTFRVSLHEGRPECFDGCGGRRIIMDAEQVRGPLLVRSRVPGDRLHPLGAAGSRKLKALLIDLKVPRPQRDKIPIVCDDEGIVWVTGVRQAHRTQVTEHTNRYIIMEAN